jgi:hypothetical protein
MPDWNEIILPRPFSPSPGTADILFRYSSAHGRVEADKVCQAIGAWLLNESRIACAKADFSPVDLGQRRMTHAVVMTFGFPEFVRTLIEESLWADVIHSLRSKGAMQGAWGRVELIDESVIMYPRDSGIQIPPPPTYADIIRAGA